MASLGVFGVRVDHASPDRLEANCQHSANADSDESKTRETGAPVPVLHKNDGVRYEAEIQNGVDDGDPVSD